MSDSGRKIIQNDFLLQKIMDQTDFASRANLIIAINSSADQHSKESLERVLNCRSRKGKFYCPACIFSYQSTYIEYSHGLGDIDFHLNSRIRDIKYPLYNFIISPEIEVINGVKTIKIVDSDHLYGLKTPKRPKFKQEFDQYNEDQLKALRYWYKLVYRSDLPSFTDLDDWLSHMKAFHFSNERIHPWETKSYSVKRKIKKFRDIEGNTRVKQYPPLDFDISVKLSFTRLEVQQITCLADFVKMGITFYDPVEYMHQPNGLDWASMDISNRLCSNLYTVFANFISLGGFYDPGNMKDAQLFSITSAFRFMRTLIRTARFPLTTDPESYKMLAHYVILDETYKVVFQKCFGESFNEHQNWSVLEEAQQFQVDWAFFRRDLSPY